MSRTEITTMKLGFASKVAGAAAGSGVGVIREGIGPDSVGAIKLM